MTHDWPTLVRAALPPARPGEILPRRDHVVRLFWIAVPGTLPILTATDPGELLERPLPWLASLAAVGAAVGAAQLAWCWRGTVPRARWVLYAALGWATGAVGGILLAMALLLGLHWLGIDLERAAGRQVLHVVVGAAAGWNAGSLQAMLLRRRGQPWRWWVYASAGTAAAAALFPLLVSGHFFEY